MLYGGVPDLFRSASFSQPVNQTREALTKASVEVVTGRKEELARSLGGDTGTYNLITKAIADIEADVPRLSLADNRLAQTGEAVKAIREGVEGIAATTDELVVNFPVTQGQVEATARARIEATLGFLNTDLGGRRLFAGDEVGAAAVTDPATFFASVETAIGGATDRASIDAAITTYFAPGGGFESEVYLGGDGDAASVALPTGDEATFATRADNTAFRQLLEGYTRLVYLSDDDPAGAARAGADVLREAEGAVIALEASIGRERRAIADAQEAVAGEKTLLLESENDFAGVDSYEAATRYQQLEGALQAAYTLTARLSQLTLTNFVR